jgi:hypothetical protein
MLHGGDGMTAPTVWQAVVQVTDDRGRYPVVIGTYATAREANAIAHRHVILHAVPMAVEVTP